MNFVQRASSYGNACVAYFILQTEEIVQEQLNELIVNYREDPDLQNLIDALQADVSWHYLASYPGLYVHAIAITIYTAVRMLWH